MPHARSRDAALVWFSRRISSVWTMSIETFVAAASAGQEVVSIPSASEKRPSNTAGSVPAGGTVITVPAGGTVITWICSAGTWASHRWVMSRASVTGARVWRCEARKSGHLMPSWPTLFTLSCHSEGSIAARLLAITITVQPSRLQRPDDAVNVLLG